MEDQKNKDISQFSEHMWLIIEIIMVSLMDNLTSFEDYLRFSDFCRSFQSFAREVRWYQNPWVMLGNKPGDKTRPFYSPFEGKVYNVKLPKVVRRSWCCGSFQGWLILAHKTRGNFMYNPISRQRVRLPAYQLENIDAFGRGIVREPRQYIKRCPYFLTKVVLSSLPSYSTSPVLAAAITGNYDILVTVLIPGMDNKWHHFNLITLEEEEEGPLSPVDPQLTFFPEEEHDKDEEEEFEVGARTNAHFKEMEITDIIFYKGEFYAVNNNGNLIIFKVVNDQDISLVKLHMAPLILKRNEFRFYNVNYLVESCHGDLLMVVRTRDKDRYHGVTRYETENVVVFRLDESSGEPFTWVRMESLRDQVLFLGLHYSKSVASCDIQILSGDTKLGRENCIYFTDHHNNHYYDRHIETKAYEGLEVYHLDDGRIDELLPSELGHHLFIFKCQPMIFTPNPW